MSRSTISRRAPGAAGRTIQASRQLVQQDSVFALFNTLGTSNNLAIRDFLNQSGVPQLFVASGFLIIQHPEKISHGESGTVDNSFECLLTVSHFWPWRIQQMVAEAMNSRFNFTDFAAVVGIIPEFAARTGQEVKSIVLRSFDRDRS